MNGALASMTNLIAIYFSTESVKEYTTCYGKVFLWGNKDSCMHTYHWKWNRYSKCQHNDSPVCRTIWARAAVSGGFSSQCFTLPFFFWQKICCMKSEVWTSSSLLFFSTAVARKSRKIRQRGFHIPLLHWQVFAFQNCHGELLQQCFIIFCFFLIYLWS